MEEFRHRPDEVIAVNVYHDDWCGRLNGSLECTCDPIIEERKIGDTAKYIVLQ